MFQYEDFWIITLRNLYFGEVETPYTWLGWVRRNQTKPKVLHYYSGGVPVVGLRVHTGKRAAIRRRAARGTGVSRHLSAPHEISHGVRGVSGGPSIGPHWTERGKPLCLPVPKSQSSLTAVSMWGEQLWRSWQQFLCSKPLVETSPWHPREFNFVLKCVKTEGKFSLFEYFLVKVSIYEDAIDYFEGVLFGTKFVWVEHRWLIVQEVSAPRYSNPLAGVSYWRGIIAYGYSMNLRSMIFQK